MSPFRRVLKMFLKIQTEADVLTDTTRRAVGAVLRDIEMASSQGAAQVAPLRHEADQDPSSCTSGAQAVQSKEQNEARGSAAVHQGAHFGASTGCPRLLPFTDAPRSSQKLFPRLMSTIAIFAPNCTVSAGAGEVHESGAANTLPLS